MARKIKGQGQVLSGSPSGQFTNFSPKPIQANRAPTTADTGYEIGQLWADTTGTTMYGLSAVSGGSATWNLLGPGASDVDTLTGDSGGAISPAGGNINIVGGNLGTFVGAGSTLTYTEGTNAYPITPYVVGSSGEAGYTTIQSAVTAANAAGGGVVFIQPGTYTEDLTLFDGVSLFGSSESDTTIVGTHTPPNSGTVNIFRIAFEDATAIFSSAAAGSTTLLVEDSSFNVTNGFAFDLDNWTGAIGLFDIGNIGTNDGGINNSGGATVFMYASGLGNGTGQTMVLSGTVIINSSDIACPIDFQTGATGGIDNTVITAGITFSNNSSIAITNCRISSGAVASITMSSSGACSVNNCVLDSSNNPVIDGAGAGTLSLGSVTLLDDTNVAGTLTVTYETTIGSFTTSGGLTVVGNFAQTGGTFNVGQDNAANAINIGGGTVARAIAIGDSAAAHTLTIGTVTGAASLDLKAGTGNFTLEGDVATTYAISGTGANTGTITISGGTGAQTTNIATGGTGIKTVNIGTGAIDNVITIGTVTGAASLDLRAGTGNFTLEGDVATTYAISATGANTGTITIGGGTGAQTTNIATGGTGIKTVNIATGAIDNVVTIGTVTGAASLDLKAGTGNFTLEGDVATTYDISNTGVNTGAVNIAGGTGARTITIGGGGTGAKTIDIGAAASADIITIGSTTGAGSLDLRAGTGNFTLEGDVATTYGISATGVNTGTITIGGGTGAQTTNIATGGTGIKTVNIATGAIDNVVTIGSTTGAASLTLQSGTGEITVTGTVKEISAEFLEASGDEITAITQNPILQAIADTGAAPVGTINVANIMYLQQGVAMEVYNVTAQTIIAPRMDTFGLNIALDQANGEGAEYNWGAGRTNSRHAFTIGTSPAFFFEVGLYIDDMDGAAPYVIGFRKSEANNATFSDYTDYASIGMIAASSTTNIVLATELNAGGQTVTDTTDAWGGDQSTNTLRVLVSAAGVVTYTINGSAPSATAAFTFDNGDVVCPFIRVGHSASATDVGITSLKVGFQA